MYSKMLYMKADVKTRVTFRIDPLLAAALRALPNQTLFVESALLTALGESCPLCEGRGRVPARMLRISDFKRQELPRLSSRLALRLREVVRLGRQLLATDLKLTRDDERDDALSFKLLRHKQTLLSGNIKARTGVDFAVH
jgi:hypothetical protein